MVWNFSQYRQNIALEDRTGESLTYQELEEAGNQTARAIGERCLVFSLCTNSIGSVVGYTGFLQNRIVPLLLSANLDRKLLLSLVKTYQPAYIWYPKCIQMQEAGIKGTIIYEKYKYCLLELDDKEIREDLYPELGLLLTTSGSTGSPKLVRQSYTNIRTNAQQIVQYLKLDSSERPITTLPMNYTYGLSIINSHLMAGAAICLIDGTMMQKEFWDFLKEKRCTSFGGVPYTYEMLDRLRFYRMNLPYLKTMTQAGGKLGTDLHKKFAEYAKENGKNFVVMYGQCEATARMAYLPPEYAAEKQGAMGIAIPGGRLMLIDEMGNEITENGVSGELVYEGENVTLGYAEKREDLCKGDEFQGKLHTGDVARRDSDGFYYIVGRKKRFLKIYGNRVNLDEVEKLIKSNFQNLECACCGVDDKMYIFITNGSSAEEVKLFASHKTGLNPLAFHVYTIESLPKNEAGKTLYGELTKYKGEKD